MKKPLPLPFFAFKPPETREIITAKNTSTRQNLPIIPLYTTLTPDKAQKLRFLSAHPARATSPYRDMPLTRHRPHLFVHLVHLPRYRQRPRQPLRPRLVADALQTPLSPL